MTPQSLEKLAPFRRADAERHALSRADTRPDHLCVGLFGQTSFVVTLDADGHCEVSLVAKSGRPSTGQIKAFFRTLGEDVPLDPPMKIKGGLFWVLQEGVPQ